jgi:hypothetical protein
MSAILGILALAMSSPDGDLSRHIYPLAPAMVCPEVVVDTSEFPAGEAWGKAAQGLVSEWFGKVTQLLATDGKDPVTKESKAGD